MCAIVPLFLIAGATKHEQFYGKRLEFLQRPLGCGDLVRHTQFGISI